MDSDLGKDSLQCSVSDIRLPVTEPALHLPFCRHRVIESETTGNWRRLAGLRGTGSLKMKRPVNELAFLCITLHYRWVTIGIDQDIHDPSCKVVTIYKLPNRETRLLADKLHGVTNGLLTPLASLAGTGCQFGWHRLPSAESRLL